MIGLVLEGGAMRGMYTAGVLDVFLEEQIRADSVVGVSAGALFGVNYLSGQNGRVIRYNKRFNQDKRYLGLKPLITEGNIVSTEYAYHWVPEKLDPFDNDSFMSSGVPFYAVVTNVKTGQAEYIRIEDAFAQMDTLRASGSMPYVSKPVRIGNQLYLDGGISDSIPIQWMKRQGADKMIVVLTREEEYHKGIGSSLAAGMYLRKYPEIFRQLKDRPKNYNRTMDLLRIWEEKGKAFVIRPSEPVRISKIEKDPDALQQLYELGRRDAAMRLEALCSYLQR